MSFVDRRSLLVGMAAGSLAAATAVRAQPTGAPASAAAPPVAQAPGFYRYRVGSLTLTSLQDGFALRKLDASFVRNAPFEDVRAALAEAFLPQDTLPVPFNPLLVDTGNRRILVDAGTGGMSGPNSGLLMANLAAAGIAPESIDTVLISHFHGDHIGGLKTRQNAVAFPKAEVLVPAPEWAFWMDDGQMSRAPQPMQGAFANVRRVFGDLGERVRRFAWDAELAPGITAIAAPGHTPGHTVFHIASGSDTLMYLADVANHPALFVRNPDWMVSFDMDGEAARLMRRKLFDRIAANRQQVASFHFPFPSTGYIAKEGDRCRFVPVQWTPQV